MLHAIKLLSKYVWLISVEKIGFIRSCDMEVIKTTGCIIKVRITSGNIKWRSLALRFRASNQKSHDNLCFPLRRAYLLHYARVKVIFTFPFFSFYPLASTSCWKDPDIYIQLDVSSMNYYCWHYPWGKRLGGNTIRPYLSMYPIKTPYP